MFPKHKVFFVAMSSLIALIGVNNFSSYDDVSTDKAFLSFDLLQHVGDEYQWGANPSSTDSFDCSSLVCHAYSAIGIKLPRTSYAQYRFLGKNVTPEELEVGDLLFYLTDKNRKIPVTHVKIYIGNGRTIEAKGKKYGVIVDNVDFDNLVGCKRVIGEL